eukprot:s1078_g15.t1
MSRSTFPPPDGLPIPPLTSGRFYSPNGSYVMTMLRLGHSVGPKVLVRTDFWLLLSLHLAAFAAYNSGFMGEKGGGWRLGLQELEWSDVELMFVLMSCALCFAVNQAYFRYLQLGQLVRKTMDSIYDFAFEARLFLRKENEPLVLGFSFGGLGSEIVRPTWLSMGCGFADPGPVRDQDDLLKLVDLEFIRPGEADFLDPHSLSARQRTLVMMHTACDCALHGSGKAEVAPATQRDLLQRLVDCKSYQLQLLDAANAMLPFEYFHLLSTLVILTTAYLGLCVGLCDSWIVPPAYATSLLIILGLFELLNSLNYPFDGVHEADFPLNSWVTHFLSNLTVLLNYSHGGTRSSWEAELKEEAAHPVQFPLTEEQVNSILSGDASRLLHKQAARPTSHGEQVLASAGGSAKTVRFESPAVPWYKAAMGYTAVGTEEADGPLLGAGLGETMLGRMGEGDFARKLRLPLPETFSGNPADWEEWSWNFKAYISMFETGAVTFMDRAELRADEFLDEHLQVTVDTGDVIAEQTANRGLFSRMLHYLISQLVKDSGKLIVRQNEDSNGFETWRRFYKKFSLPGATRSTSLLTQLLDFKFNPATFEQDFNVWETIKSRYERQSGQPLPDGVLVATWLNKTTGALQQHLRLNARTLQTYAQGGASAPMDIGHFASNCPNYRVSAVEGEELYPSDDAGDWSHFGEDDWSDWTDWAINAVTEQNNDPSSWDQTWDDQLWSWDTWSWDASWDPWGWSSDFTSDVWPTTSEAAPSAKAETLAKPKEEASSSSGAATLPVSAVTLEGPPGLSVPKAKPTAKASISPSTLLMSAAVLGNFGLGNTFRVDGMTDGVVVFNFGGFRGCENFEPRAYMAPLETFSLNGRADENQRLFSVGDLGLQNLNTTFKDVALEGHLIASTLEDSEPWILFDSGAATHCCSKDFASEWPFLPLTGKAPPLRSISGQPLTVFGRRLVKVDFEGQPCFLHFYVCDVPYSVVSVGRL